MKGLRGAESQNDFGKKFMLTQADISRIERGDVKPTPELLFNICIFYEKDLEWLLTGEGQMERHIYNAAISGLSA